MIEAMLGWTDICQVLAHASLKFSHSLDDVPCFTNSPRIKCWLELAIGHVIRLTASSRELLNGTSVSWIFGLRIFLLRCMLSIALTI